MTKKRKGWLIFGIVAGVLGTLAVLALSLCLGLWFLFPTPQWKREQIYAQHADPAREQTLLVTISELHVFEDGEGRFSVVLDEAAYLRDYGEESGGRYAGLANRFRLVPENVKLLEESGFFGAYTADTVITLTVSPGIHWDGDSHPVFAISAGDTVYLPYEAGRANYLNWIMNEMY